MIEKPQLDVHALTNSKNREICDIKAFDILIMRFRVILQIF